MLKVAPLSTVVSSPQRTSFDEEEKEKERIFPSTVPYIQNHLVTKTKTHDQDFPLFSSSLLTMPRDVPLSLYRLVLLSVYWYYFEPILYCHFPHALSISFSEDNNDHDVPFDEP